MAGEHRAEHSSTHGRSAGAPPAPHHDGSPLHVETQTPPLGDAVRVRIRIPDAAGPFDEVWLRSTPDTEPAWAPAERLGSVEGWTWWEATLTVANPRTGYRWLLVPAAASAPADPARPGRAIWVNQTGTQVTEPRDADDFALVAGNPPPEWMTSSVMYQVFPDRFARSAAASARLETELPDWAIAAEWDDPLDPEPPGRSAQLFGGDLDGIAERLDHLVGLGVDLLYLTPVFPGRSNHRYDASTFDRVDPLLGGDEALARLVEAAHARGIRVIGDLTTNHSGDGHEWFRRAHGRPDAAEGDFYLWLDAEHTEYVYWLAAPSLPKFDWTSDELRRRFIDGPDSVVGRWLRPPIALDGWRIDVANMTGRLGDVDLNADVRRTIRRTMEAVKPDTLLIAESTNDAAADFQGDAWHGAMTYPGFTRPVWAWLRDEDADDSWFFGQPPRAVARWTGHEMVEQMTRFAAGFPWRVRLGNMNALDTHDTARFATFAAPGAVPVALGLAVTLPGLPTIWAGDEFGLHGVDGEMSRTPLPWGSEDDPEVARVLATYRELIALRRAHPVLQTGGCRILAVSDDAIAFVRESSEECVLVLAARAAATLELAAEALPGGVAGAVRATGDARLEASDTSTRLVGDGIGFTAWTLPGLAAPAWAPR